MGWGRTFLLGDIGNRLDIDDVERDVRNIQREMEDSFRKDLSRDEIVERLVTENNQLKLYLVSLIRALTQKGIISKAELTAMVTAIDTEDGKADGKYDGDIT